MSKNIIKTDRAPAAIGPYSQATRHGDIVFLSGQIALDPATMELVNGSVEEEAHRVFRNLQAVCEAAGGSLDQLLKVNVYLTDMDYFPVLNSIMAEYFNQPYPARAAVGVSQLPKGVRIEIEGVMGL
jgi:reactive intermediate/imine deaminase